MAFGGKVLIVGGGLGGTSCALALRRAGISVDLLEIDPSWKVFAAGLTLTGPGVGALERLGVLEEVKQRGATWQGACVFNQRGEPIEEPPAAPMAAGPGGTVGILRSELHKIIATRALAAGVHVRLGTTVETLSQVPAGVEVKLTNGHREQYRLVVGADGIYSKLRERVFPHAPKPRFTGQAIYRLIAERTRAIDRSHIYVGADAKLGLHPISRTHLYLSLLQRSASNRWIALEDQPRRLYDALNGWGGAVPEVRKTVLNGAANTVNYRPLESVLLPDPWYRERVVLIGDAARASASHLAAGIGLAIEDGVVLAEEIARDGDIAAALPRFMQRRVERRTRERSANSVRTAGGAPHAPAP